MSKRITKWLSWLLVFALVLSNIPSEVIAWAVDAYKKEVRVIIKNETLKTADGAAWEGVLFDKKVELKEDSTAMSVVADAVRSEGYTVTGAESGYITEINNLKEKDDAAGMGGWMGTLNDWFTNEGFSAFTVASGKLQDGDEICFMYTCAWGADIGSDWSSTSTLLKDISFSDGILNKPFDSNTMEYVLNIPKDVTEILVTPTAENKNFMVKTYKNTYTPTVNGSEYKRTQKIPVTDGDKIYIGVGYTDEDSTKSWPSMNAGHKGSCYTIHVKYAEEVAEKPYFEQLNFGAYAINGWVTDETFSPELLEYDIDIKSYSTSTLTLTSSTKYDSDKYDAKAYYKGVNGDDKEVDVLNGRMTSLTEIPFGISTMKIVLEDKADSANSTTYTFHLTRPYDTSVGLNASSGMVIVPNGRMLLSTLYLDKAEGTLFKLDENGEILSSGMSASCNDYKAFVLEGLKKFSVKLTGKTAYVHIRISEDGENYTEVKTGMTSPAYEFGDKSEKKLTIQTISDEEYKDNGFNNVAEHGNTYTLTVVSVNEDTGSAKFLTADSDSGEWYPVFNKDVFSYGLVMEHDAEFPVVSFTIPDGSKAMLGSNELIADENGTYSLTLKTVAQSVKVVAENGIINTYSFKAVKKSAYDVPDKVVDYLCINSQYTNGSYGIEPMMTLSGSLKSLGNFGGYITYYYEDAIVDDPANKYGIDFYVYGNSFASGGSAAESGQVWVSEDGEQWYALAGSEHYEDSTITDYEITYTKTESGRTAWADNYGGSNDGSSKAGAWPSTSVYYMNKQAKGDSITLKGILLPCIDGTLYGDNSTGSFANTTHFGYVDYFKNGTIGADVNPYTAEEGSNGFDLKWAVDEEGNPVELKNGIHYVKVVTASNIWAGAFNEKSTEVSYVVRTAKQEENVGVTKTPAEIVITDENGIQSTVALDENTQSYEVKLNDVKKVNISVTGADENDNIYVNNKRIASAENAEITIGDAGKTVRLIVQNGDKEPVIYMLNLASESAAKTQRIFEETTDALLKGDAPIVNSIGGEWKTIGLARAEKISDEFKKGYFKNVYEYVKANGSATLHRAKSTDNSRVILALTSLGYEVKDVAGFNLLEPLADFDYVIKQGVNGAIWALIALDSADYEIPALTGEGIQATRENIIAHILDSQLENGGYALDDENFDVDITAMAIQALTPYYDSDENVKAAVDKAVALLSSVQNEDGSFGSNGAANTESTAQVVIALSGLKINPRTDERFIKNGTSVLSALNNYYAGDGAFVHVAGGDANEMATEQAYLALVSYLRLNESKTNVYDMSDVVMGRNPVIKDETDNKPDNDQNNNAGDNNSNNNNQGGNDIDNQSDKDNKNDSLPKTGDNTNILLYVLLMSGSVTGALIAFRRRRKSEN